MDQPGSTESVDATIVITTKDRKKDLRRAVQSAVEQTASPEVLVVDDGSSDGTAQMIRDDFPGVRVSSSEESRGYIVRRNQGAEMAKGDVIFSIDDDAEFSSPDVVEQTLQEFGDPRVGAVAMPYVDVNRSSEVRQKAPEEERYCAFSFRGTAHALRRDLFLALGGYREHLIHQGEEMDYCVRMLDAGYVVRLGRSDIIKHYESPKRSYERMDFYGRRNDVLFGWHNVPSSELPLYFLLSIINTFRTAIDIGRFRHLFMGMLAGFRDCFRYSDARDPVAPETYRLYRDLQRKGPRKIVDIEESLQETSTSPSSIQYAEEEDVGGDTSSISREDASMNNLQNERSEVADLEHILDEIGDPIVVVTHPRSGTHLTLDLLRKQFEACKATLGFGETLHHLYVDLDRLQASHPHPMSLDEAADLLRRAPRPTVKTHSLPSLPEHSGPKRDLAQALIEKGDLLYVVRDGRDALCSTHIWKKEDEPKLADYSLPEFLRLEKQGRTRVQYWAEHVRQWTQRPDTYVLQFEDILERPEEVVEHLGDELRLDPLYTRPLLPEQVMGGRWTFYWRRLTRNFESTAINGRPNGEEPANWRKAFSEEDRRLFQEQAGEVLKDFGYVTDESWPNSFK